MIRNSTFDTASTNDVTCAAGSPTSASAMPNKTAKNSTWRTSLRASASIDVVGMIFMMKLPTPAPFRFLAWSA